MSLVSPKATESQLIMEVRHSHADLVDQEIPALTVTTADEERSSFVSTSPPLALSETAVSPTTSSRYSILFHRPALC
jgi:hypothetical protein